MLYSSGTLPVLFRAFSVSSVDHIRTICCKSLSGLVNEVSDLGSDNPSSIPACGRLFDIFLEFVVFSNSTTNFTK